MPFSTYSELKTAIAGELHRTDLTTKIIDFVSQCESRLQKVCKLVEFEASGSVAVTNGTGTLPTDYAGMRSAHWSYSPERPLTYITPDRFAALLRESGVPDNYTIVGSSIKVAPGLTGTLTIDYKARFSPLSDNNTTNSLLTNHPNVYLYGSLIYAGFHTRDSGLVASAREMFNDEVSLVRMDNAERKYGSALQVRPR